ncbi:MAG: glycosyltransferase family 2 protein [bacterium]
MFEQGNLPANVVVIIPALNEENSIGKVLQDIPQELNTQVIVVDNGSLDKTAEVARQYGAIVVEEKQRGYGRACLAGMDAAKKLDPDVIVFLDADYSDFPEDMVALTDPIFTNDFDLVIGSRVRGEREKGALLPQARFGNWLASFLIRMFWGFQYTDLGPFRAIKWRALEKLNMKDKTFGWTVEMQVKTLQQNLKVAEVPVRYRKRIGVSKVTGTLSGTIKAGYKILWTIFKYRFFD